MSMMCPPHRVKMVSTPSFFRALATRCPPEMTSASRLLRLSVSSAVVVPLVSAILGAVSSMHASIHNKVSATPAVLSRRPRSSGVRPEERGRSVASARRQLRAWIYAHGPGGVRGAHGLEDHDGHQGRQDVERGGGDEYRVPISFRGDPHA